MKGHFELKRTEGGRFMFNLKAGNGEIILTSGLYDGKAAASEGIATVIACAHDESNIERKVASNRKPFFVLKSAAGDFLAKSEMYSSAAAMEKGIKSVLQNVGGATLKDLTELEPELAKR